MARPDPHPLGEAARVLFPSVKQDTTPAAVGEAPELTDDDFFTAGTEDRYLDVFRLAPDVTF